MKKIFVWVTLFLLVFSLGNSPKVLADSQGYTFENVTKRTNSAHFKNIFAQLQVVGSKIYYVWQEESYVGGPDQIWTAEMNTDGSGFVATKRTTSIFDKWRPQLVAEGTKIYYVWGEDDGSNDQIWTAEMNTDGSGFTATKRTTSAFDKSSPQMQVVAGKIYYTWMENDGSNDQIWTAEMNTDGSGFTATKRTTSAFGKKNPQLQVEGIKIYYVWGEADGSNDQIWTAEMNTDGSGFTATKRTTSAFGKWEPQLRVEGNKIYYVWWEHDGGNYQIWTAEMNTDGSGFTATKRTTSAFYKMYSQLQVEGTKIYYVWYEYDVSFIGQIWTAEMNTDGSGFTATKQTTSAFTKIFPQLQAEGVKIYYVWSEDDGNDNEIWTADGSYQMIIDEGTTVTASVPASLTLTIAGVSSGSACANSGGNASVTSTASTIPFGTYTGAATKIACQTLTTSTNATDGYVITVEQNQDMTSGGSDLMDKFSGTYAVPTTWSSPPGSGTESYFGFTTDDTDYSDFQTSKYGSFAVNDTPYNIAIETDPVADEVNVMSYQLEITDNQESGVYTNNIMYIATAIF